MLIKEIRIKNFKGVQNAKIKLNQNGQGKIYTLVGLNESGKTTILEAINSFSPDLEAEQVFQNDVFRRIEPKDLVPKHKKDNFSDQITIEMILEITEDDSKRIQEYILQEHGLLIEKEKLEEPVSVKRLFEFSQSDFKNQSTIWEINLNVKTKAQKKFRGLYCENKEKWQEVISFIRTLIPKICYFPTFLFEFPERVYLANPPETAEPQNKYYLQVIQDILDSLDRELTIQEHIIKRVEFVPEGKRWDYFEFMKSDRKDQIDAVMNHLSNQITKYIFTRWNEIFKSTFTKRIKIDWEVDGNTPNSPIYLSFSIQDGTSTYSITERSLGFRWFFCFLLFTQFRRSRKENGTLFLLDEPASNLHSTAQKQLLESFSAVTEGESCLIYSTHSHYMINPKWLEGAFIVQNKSIEYDDKLMSSHEFQDYESNVTVTSYKSFVGKNPDKQTYFQPILDSLDYSPSILEHQKKSIFVEGKSDFYFLTYFNQIIFEENEDLRFMPSSGSNEMGPLISLYLGWGYPFLVILDDDIAGKEAKKKYKEEWYLSDDTITTLVEFNPNLKGKKLESLISGEGKRLIQEDIGESHLSKKNFARFFQEKLSKKERFTFDDETMSLLGHFFDKLKNHSLLINYLD